MNHYFFSLIRVSSPAIFIQPLKGQRVARYATEADSKERIPAPGKDAADNPRVASLVDQIASLTLIETSELVKLLKSRLNIQDVVLPAVSLAASTTTAPTASAPVEEEKAPEKTEFTVKLEKYDAAAKTKIIREIKNLLPGTNLVEAKKFVESVPKVVKENVNKEEAEKIKKTLEGLGGTVIFE
ncbi:ribosomal protein L7/L12 C-terminal domain-containing protein [Glomus cerebriforme]|uniref:Ribosomal protein L7/L12 C-terminal domain-containing protein n=1 Tax=Glomus cerebriforme TaxID=658196 RepID=A0A397TQ11_9GLOM|nr:ribosomal protein L7/L12 C-terminal domain-containing protein [Glomus cerebriforme]